jgi:hypothetical protein
MASGDRNSQLTTGCSGRRLETICRLRCFFSASRLKGKAVPILRIARESYLIGNGCVAGGKGLEQLQKQPSRLALADARHDLARQSVEGACQVEKALAVVKTALMRSGEFRGAALCEW